MVEENPHSLEELIEMENSLSLNKGDWIFFKSIYLKKRTTFKLCSCGLTKSGQFNYNLDEKKTYKAPHAASGLGEIHTRFKCSAKNCNKTFSVKDFLVAYLTMKKNSVALGKRAREPTASPTPIKVAKDTLDWSEMDIDTDNTPTPFFATQSSSVPLENDVSNAAILDMLTDFRRDTLIMQSKQQTKFDSVFNLLDKVVNKNIELEKKLEQLHDRLIALEGREPTVSPPQLSLPPSNVMSLPSNPSSVTWAAVASLPPQVAVQKATENSQSMSRSNGFIALKNLVKKRTSRTRNDLEDTSVVNITGFEFQKYGPIWKALRAAKFQTSRIHNMQWIGKTVLEFVVSADYKTQFSAEIEVAGFKVRDFDCSKNVNAVTPQQATLAKTSFVIRVVKNILFHSNMAVRGHFQKVADAACAADEETADIYQKEFDKASAVRNDKIATLIDSLVMSELSDEDYAKQIMELCELDSNHSLVREFFNSKNAGMGSTEDHHASEH
jgi:hypothetical protein